MKKYYVEDVYTTTGVPTVTYVKPKEYLSLLVALRTKGRCVVVEGPSGIGKTTAVDKVLAELGVTDKVIKLSARKNVDLSKIEEIGNGNFDGIAIIDDFHRLSAALQKKISDVMKCLADESSDEKKIIVIGINRVGDTLVKFSPDLNNRISTIHFETNSDDKIEELISLGENALQIKFNNTEEITRHCFGSFHIAQLMCQKACVQQGIIETCEEENVIHFSYPIVSGEMMNEFSRSYFETARTFATGTRLRREGRAPYLHILKWLAESNSWSILLTTEIQRHPEQKAGVIQVVEKGYLADLLVKKPEIGNYIHFDSTSRILSVEDPKFMFYLKGINWNNFAKDVGYVQLVTKPQYDYALSFSGKDRILVEKVFEELNKREIAVFYDKNEQVDILACNVEEYLYPIYNSNAVYVVPFMSKDYPNRIWTHIESKAFKDRFGQNSVIPIWFSNVDNSMFDESKSYGGITYNVDEDIDEQVQIIAEYLSKKIERNREKTTELAGIG